MLSIIVCVFNVRPYIEECINSLRGLRIPCEILIVHDPEKDESFNGDELFLKDDRIRILNRANAGLSIARNQGLEEAKGEYIYFIDGDDKIYPDRFEELYLRGVEHDADIIAGDYDDTETQKKCAGPKSSKPIIISGKEFLKDYPYTMTRCVWRYVFRKKFLENSNLVFEPVKYFEDIIYLPLALYDCKLIYFENIPFYYYRYIEGSLSNVFNKRRTSDVLTAFEVLNNKFSIIPEKDLKDVMMKTINTMALNNIEQSYRHGILDDELILKAKSVLNNMTADGFITSVLLTANKISWKCYIRVSYYYYTVRHFIGKIRKRF